MRRASNVPVINRIWLSISIALVAAAMTTCAQPASETISAGEQLYLGEEPPGLTAKLFRRGQLVDHPNGERRSFNLSFAPDGTELFFSYYKGTEEIPHPEYEIKTFKNRNGAWYGPETASFSGQFSDVDINFSPEGDHLFFCSDRPQPNSAGLDIYYLKKEEHGWSEPIYAGTEVNTMEGEVCPSLSEKNNLFFRSGRPGGLSGSDIYRAEWIDGEFVDVRNLGPNVNSPHGQSNSFVSADESFILFVSARPESNNAYQIYVSFQTGDNQWTPAVRLGPEVNTAAGAGAPTLSPDGRYLFFKRRDGSERGLYWISSEIIQRHR